MTFVKGWVPSLETRRRMSLSAQRRHRPCSEEAKVRIGNANRGKKPAAITIQRSVDARKELMKDPEHRQWFRTLRKKLTAGKDVSHLHTPEARKKMTATRRSQRALNVENGLRAMKKWRRWHEYLDRQGRIWKFRSSWERDFAIWLDRQEMTWLFEPHRLLLSDGRVFTPDFWVEEWKTYVEIKGWCREESFSKITEAQSDGHPMMLIGNRPDGIQYRSFEAAMNGCLLQQRRVEL